MEQKENLILTGLKIATWIVFIGLCIETGTLIFNFILSFYQKNFSNNLYESINLSELYAQSPPLFIGFFSMVISLMVIKTQIAYAALNILLKLDLNKPFSVQTNKQIFNISYLSLLFAAASHISYKTARHYDKRDYVLEPLYPFFDSASEYLLFGGIVYIIAYIFKKGLDLQNDIDLTV